MVLAVKNVNCKKKCHGDVRYTIFLFSSCITVLNVDMKKKIFICSLYAPVD